MLLKGKNAMRLRSYNAKVLEEIYQNGIREMQSQYRKPTKTEMALGICAGHTIDMIQAAKDLAEHQPDMTLDLHLETLANLEPVMIFMIVQMLRDGENESFVRNQAAKKLSAYLMFTVWNTFSDASGMEREWELSIAPDPVTGMVRLNKQIVHIRDTKNAANRVDFDALKIGETFFRDHVMMSMDEDNMPLVAVGVSALRQMIDQELKLFRA